MRLFVERRGAFVASFDVAEVRLLSDLVGQVRQLLELRRAETPSDPLAELTGFSPGPSAPPVDPAMSRLLPDFLREDAVTSAGIRMLREPEVVAAKDDAAIRMLESLPPSGGSVTLDEVDARSWLVALNDLRLIFGARLGISEDSADSADEYEGPEQAMYLTYRWLSVLQESLVTAMLGVHEDDD